MWIVCPLCGALVAEHERHETWHAANGEHYPGKEPVIDPEPPVDPEPDPLPAPDPEPAPEEAP